MVATVMFDRSRLAGYALLRFFMSSAPIRAFVAATSRGGMATASPGDAALSSSCRRFWLECPSRWWAGRVIRVGQGHLAEASRVSGRPGAAFSRVTGCASIAGVSPRNALGLRLIRGGFAGAVYAECAHAPHVLSGGHVSGSVHARRKTALPCAFAKSRLRFPVFGPCRSAALEARIGGGAGASAPNVRAGSDRNRTGRLMDGFPRPGGAGPE